MVTNLVEITFDDIKRSKPDLTSRFYSEDLEASIKEIQAAIKKEGSCYSSFNNPGGVCHKCYFGYVTLDLDFDCSLKEELKKKLEPYISDKDLYDYMLRMTEIHFSRPKK